MTNTDSFWAGSADTPEAAQPEPDRNTRSTVESLSARRDRKRHLEQQARRAAELEEAAGDPQWTWQDTELHEAGWIPTLSRGIRLWQKVAGGFYKQTEFAHAQLVRTRSGEKRSHDDG